jgi:hypothetical protein
MHVYVGVRLYTNSSLVRRSLHIIISFHKRIIITSMIFTGLTIGQAIVSCIRTELHTLRKFVNGVSLPAVQNDSIVVMSTHDI